MAELPSHIGSFIWLAATNESLEGTHEAPEVYDNKAIKIFYHDTTNRLVILGDDDGRREIPTFLAGFTVPPSFGLLMINGQGDLASYPEVNSLDPLIEVGAFSMPIRWPAADALVGAVSYTGAVSPQTAIDSSTVNRAIQETVLAPVAITSLTASSTYNYSIRVDCNVGTKQTLFTLDTDENFVVTDIIISYDDGALTAAECTFGWNANADDVVANTRYSSITGADTYTKATILAGAKRGTSTQSFGVKFSTTEAIHLRVDVIGIKRYLP